MGPRKLYEKTKGKAFKRQSKDADDLKFIEFIDCFQQSLNDPTSTLIAIEETMHIMKEQHNTETNISIRMM